MEETPTPISSTCRHLSTPSAWVRDAPVGPNRAVSRLRDVAGS